MNDFERDYLSHKPGRGAVVVYIVAALFVAFLLWQLFIRNADAGDPLPRSITTTAPVKYVNCGGGVCCGEVTVVYHGHYYGNPSYCKWWRPGRAWPTLREGQNVTATLRLWR